MRVTPQPNILRVSLEPHLVEKLRPLVHAIPAPLSAELTPLLSGTTSSSTPTISYALLFSLSKWTRTEEGARELKSNDPPLDPLAYSMVALLAGTRTSPDKKFPQLSPSPSRSESVARNISDRRAVIAVLNALLSVICTGAATWWAAQRTGWRDEWVRVERNRVLFCARITLTFYASDVPSNRISESSPVVVCRDNRRDV